MNSTVLKHQYVLIIIALSLVFKISMLPAFLAKEAGIDSYMSVMLILAIEMLQLFFIVRVSKSNGLATFKENFGKTAYTVFLLLCSLLGIFKASSLLLELSDYVSKYLFYTINYAPIIILLLIVVVYVSIKGPVSIGRLCELSVWFLPVGFILGIIFGKTQLSPDNILPIAGEGAGRIFAATNKYLFFVSDFTPLMFLTIKKNKKPIILIGAVINFLMIIGFYLVFIMNYGNAAHLINNAFTKIAQFGVVNTQIGSLEWPFMILWLLIAIISLSAKSFPFGELANVFGAKQVVGFIIAAVLAVLTLLFLITNIEIALTVVTSGARYVVLAVQFLLPISVLVLNKLKEQKKEVSVEQEA